MPYLFAKVQTTVYPDPTDAAWSTFTPAQRIAAKGVLEVVSRDTVDKKCPHWARLLTSGIKVGPARDKLEAKFLKNDLKRTLGSANANTYALEPAAEEVWIPLGGNAHLVEGRVMVTQPDGKTGPHPITATVKFGGKEYSVTGSLCVAVAFDEPPEA